VSSVAFSPDGRFAVSASGDGSDYVDENFDPIRLWRLPE
jgi:hypothetical protein